MKRVQQRQATQRTLRASVPSGNTAPRHESADAATVLEGPPPLPDALRLQILTTEHGSLLTTRAMTWNEVFSRAGMFLTVLSAAVVALALAAQAVGFGESFRLFALLVLPVLLLVGLGTFLRLNDITIEDARLVAGMNRLRHAYLELAPDLEPYFVTSHHDDEAGVLQTYDFADHLRPSRILAGAPLLVGVIDAVLAGVIVALVVTGLGGSLAIATAAGLAGALIIAATLAAVPFRTIGDTRQMHPPRFPR